MELKTKIRVTGLAFDDHDVLLEVANMDEIPAFGMKLPTNIDVITSDSSNLVVAKRDFQLVEGDPGTVDAMIDYEHFMMAYNQDLTVAGAFGAQVSGVPVDVSLYGKMRTSVQQTKTNFFWDKRFNISEWDIGIYAEGSLVKYKGSYWVATAAHAADNDPPDDETPYVYDDEDRVIGGGPTGWLRLDSGQGFYDTNAVDDRLAPFVVPNRRSRQLLVVGHRMPQNDRDPAIRGKVVYQSGEITVMQAHDTYSVKGVVRTAAPWVIKKQIVGAINYNPWLDGEAYEWMCTECGFEAITPFILYRMNFEFQRNPDGWRPTAIFHDSRTGKPPPDLVPGFGLRTVHNQPEMDFDEFFMAAFEGWAFSPV